MAAAIFVPSSFFDFCLRLINLEKKYKNYVAIDSSKEYIEYCNKKSNFMQILIIIDLKTNYFIVLFGVIHVIRTKYV